MREPGRRLRIAAHNGAPEWGGAEIATSLLLSGLQERGHEVVLFYNRDVVARGARGFGLHVRPAHLGGDIAIPHALRFALRLRRLRPDVLVVGTFRKLWLAGLAARLAGVPVVARIGLSSDVPRSGKYRFAFRHLVDRVVTNADDLRDAYLRRLPDAPPPLVQTIHKGIELPDAPADRDAVRRSLGAEAAGDGAAAPLIGGVGRLVSQKRFDRLIRAFAALPTAAGTGIGPRLVLVGDGPRREELEALAAELGVADRVRFTGHRRDIPAVMSALDLLVVSSDRESLANVMLEAMAAGTPVLSTPVSGAAEALAADEAGAAEKGQAPEAGQAGQGADEPRGAARVPPGRVVEPTVEALADAMAELVHHPATLSAMGRAARRTAERRFGRERMLDEWERALRAAADGPRGARAREAG